MKHWHQHHHPQQLQRKKFQWNHHIYHRLWHLHPQQLQGEGSCNGTKHCVGRLNRCCTYDRLGNSVFTVMIQPMFIYAITITIITITIIIITFTITRLCWTPTQLLARGRAAASVAVSRALSGIFSYLVSLLDFLYVMSLSSAMTAMWFCCEPEILKKCTFWKNYQKLF